MRNILKKTISILMSACMLMSATSASVIFTSAAEAKNIEVSYRDVITSGKFKYIITDSFERTACIVGETEEKIDNLEVPAKIDGYTITKIAANAYLGKGATELILPDTITEICLFSIESHTLKKITFNCTNLYINNSAISCENLSEIDFTDNLETLSFGDHSVKSQALTTLNIPESVNKVNFADWAFSKCPNLAEIHIPEKGAYFCTDAFLDTQWYVNQPDGVVMIGNYVLGYKGILKENSALSFPNGTYSIANRAFESKDNLVSVEIPDSLEYIGPIAFANCPKLKSVNIPKNVTTIERSAFHSCQNLENLVLSDGIKNIGEKAFYNCPLLKRITIPASVTQIGEKTFGYKDDDWLSDKADLCIYGYKDTAAEMYAKENGFAFKLANDIDSNEKIDVNDVTALQMHLANYDITVDTHNADVNQNRITDVSDVTNLQLILAED